jgi:DHA2 family multidrug resistance protein
LVTGALLGFSIGIISVPLTITAFATLKPEYRTDGAAISSLIRNLGASVGISVMQARIISNTQVHHAALALHARADSAIYGAYLSPPYALDTAAGLAALNRMITRQAELMAYVDNFQLMAVLVAVSMPLILLLRPPKRESPGRVAVASADKAAGRPR